MKKRLKYFIYSLKGYFPFIAERIDEFFSFVDIDFDLYKPTL